MAPDQFHTVLYHWLKPFLEILKRKDLPVSPDTHIQLVRMLEAFKDKITAENLPDFLAAVLVKNPEQLKILKQAYSDFPIVAAEGTKTTKVGTGHEQKKPPKYKYIIAATVVLASLAALILYLIPSSHSVNAHIEIIHDRNVKHPVMLSALPGLEDSADANHIHFHWDFGDGTTESGKTRVEHVYKKPGHYTVSLKISSHSPKVRVNKADTSIHLTVCPPPFQLNVNSQRVQTSELVVVTAQSSDSAYSLPQRNAWYINDTLAKRRSNKLDTSFRAPGDYTIRFASTDTDSLQCDEAITQVTVESPNSLFFNISESGPQINENNAAAAPNNAWLWALGLISIASVIPLVLVSILFAVKNRASKTKANAIISNFTGTKKPKEIPFKNQDDLIEDEKDLLSVIRVMNRRNPYEQTYLDIPQTINSTIRSEGMVQPVWRTRTRPVEYLVLIDKFNSKNLQVRLFEYLLKKFSANSIYFEKYYFKGNPETCYNAAVPEGTSLQQLHDRYPNHVLIVMGTGHELVNHDYPTLNDRLAQLFRKWEHSAICTPVSYKDWDYKEELISKAMMILPADLNAQMLLFRLIESNRILPAETLASLPAYSANYNFENVADIEKYLNDPFLFQWLCALAVYPLLQWDIMIAIGSALQKTYYSQHEVNYSALLKLVRISWMQNGSFPGRTRLELLKKLEPEHEKLARETVLKLITQAAAKMDSSSFAYEQLETQRLTNSFLLSANSTNTEYTNEFRDFKTLWEQDKIHDVQLIAYLKKTGTWSTLIEKPIDRYLKDALNVQRKRVSKIRNVLSAVTAVCLIMFTMLMMGSSTISGTKIDKLFHLTVPASGEMGTLSIAAHNCTEQFANKDSMVVSLPNNITYSFGVTDSAHMTLDLRNFAGTDSMIRFSLMSDKGIILDTTFKASRQYIELAVLGCPVPVPGCGRWILTRNETRDVEGAWYDESILLANKSSYTPVNIINSRDDRLDSIDGNQVIEYYRCSGDSTQIKAITVNPRGIFEVVYLQSFTGVSEIEIGQLNRRFSSVREARSDTTRPSFIHSIYTPVWATQYTGRQTATELQGTWNANNGDQFVLKGNSAALNSSGWTVNEIDDLQTAKIKLHRLQLSGRKWLYVFYVSNDKILLSQLQYPNDNAASARVGTVYTYQKQDTVIDAITNRVLNALKEIWVDQTGFRKFRVDPQNKLLYYNSGGNNLNRQFTIEEVRQTSFNDYQVIAERQNIYQSFFVRNLTPISFELGACPRTSSSLSQAQTNVLTECREFTLMRLYYEKDTTKIYLPVDYKTFTSTESAKLQAAINAGESDSVITFVNGAVRRNGNASALKPTLNRLKTGFGTTRLFQGDVFQRDYLKVYQQAPPVTQFSRKILWVDDIPANNSSIVSEFRRLGATFTTATTNAEALRILSREKFDLIITDIDRRTEGPTAGLRLVDTVSVLQPYASIVIYTSIQSRENNQSAPQLESVQLFTSNPEELRQYLKNFMSQGK